MSTDQGGKRKRINVMKYGFDETDSEITSSETESESEQVKKSQKKMKLKRCNAIKGAEHFPKAPPTCLGNTRDPPGEMYPQLDEDLPESSQGRSVLESSQDGSVLESSQGRSHQCHCEHQKHWAKETFRVLLRIEDFLRRTSGPSGPCTSKEATGDSPSNLKFPTTKEEVNEFFHDMNCNEEKRLEAIICVSKEVSPKLKKSVERIILRLAPPSAWIGYSKDGQRGKSSAMSIGLPKFIIECLQYSKVRAH